MVVKNREHCVLSDLQPAVLLARDVLCALFTKFALCSYDSLNSISDVGTYGLAHLGLSQPCTLDLRVRLSLPYMGQQISVQVLTIRSNMVWRLGLAPINRFYLDVFAWLRPTSRRFLRCFHTSMPIRECLSAVRSLSLVMRLLNVPNSGVRAGFTLCDADLCVEETIFRISSSHTAFPTSIVLQTMSWYAKLAYSTSSCALTSTTTKPQHINLPGLVWKNWVTRTLNAPDYEKTKIP